MAHTLFDHLYDLSTSLFEQSEWLDPMRAKLPRTSEQLARYEQIHARFLRINARLGELSAEQMSRKYRPPSRIHRQIASKTG